VFCAPQKAGGAARRPDDSQHVQRGAEAVHLTVSPNAGTESARMRILAGLTHDYARRVAMIMFGGYMGRQLMRFMHNAATARPCIVARSAMTRSQLCCRERALVGVSCPSAAAVRTRLIGALIRR
jgi:hypothetical protein